MKKLTLLFLFLCSLAGFSQAKAKQGSKTYTFKINFIDKTQKSKAWYNYVYFEVPTKKVDTLMLKKDWFFVNATDVDTIKGIVKVTLFGSNDLVYEIEAAMKGSFPETLSATANNPNKTDGFVVIRKLSQPKLCLGKLCNNAVYDKKTGTLADTLSAYAMYGAQQVKFSIMTYEVAGGGPGFYNGSGRKLFKEPYEQIKSAVSGSKIFIDARLKGPDGQIYGSNLKFTVK